MLNEIIDALNSRNDLAGWTVRHLITRGAQVYAVPGQIESQRDVKVERYRIDVLRQTTDPDGKPAVGNGDATVLPGGDIRMAVENAVLMAGLVANPVHSIPGPAVFPDVPLIDTDLYKDAAAGTKDMMERIRAAVSKNPSVELTAAECFGEIHTTHLINSRGIDAEQETTQTNVEIVLHSQRGESEVEGFTEMHRRCVADLHLEDEIEQRTRHTLDLFEAGSSPAWQGPVVLRGDALAVFEAVIVSAESASPALGSAETKYAKISMEIGNLFSE
jgi:predicted Zn-dependent protease